MEKANCRHKNQHLTYFIAPIYNVNVDETLLGKSFAGFKILLNETIFQKYSKELYYPDDLFQDIENAKGGMLIKRPTARYVFFKKLYLHNGYNEEINNKNNMIIENETENLTNLIVAMRLLKSGNIHINRVYILGKVEHHSFNLPISSFLDAMNNSFIDNKDYNFWNNYEISKKDLNNTLKIKNNLTKCYRNLWLPISYFMSYYKTPNLTDKLIRLCTIWEATLLNDCKNELNYRLIVRGSAFLERNLSDVFKIAYEIRSKLLHTGTIPNLTKLANLIKVEDKTDISKIFIFLKDYLEPITREIINKFMINYIKTGKNLKHLSESIDEIILKKLSQKG